MNVAQTLACCFAITLLSTGFYSGGIFCLLVAWLSRE